MKTEQMIEVMQAYCNGEQIEYKERVCDHEEWETLENVPTWDWYNFDYRVKTEVKIYRPYKNAEEFLTAQKKHGIYYRDKECKLIQYEQPIYVDNVLVANISPTAECDSYSTLHTYQELFDYYVWQDGTPCGVKNE